MPCRALLPHMPYSLTIKLTEFHWCSVESPPSIYGWSWAFWHRHLTSNNLVKFSWIFLFISAQLTKLNQLPDIFSDLEIFWIFCYIWSKSRKNLRPPPKKKVTFFSYFNTFCKAIWTRLWVLLWPQSSTNRHRTILLWIVLEHKNMRKHGEMRTQAIFGEKDCCKIVATFFLPKAIARLTHSLLPSLSHL